MPAYGFPAQPRQATMSSLVSQLRHKSDDARVAAVTGRHADPTAALQGRVEEMMQVEKSIAELQDYGQIIALGESRANIIQDSFDKIDRLSNELVNQSAIALQTGLSNITLPVLSEHANQQLKSAISALNIDFAGRALFAGNDAGTAALVDSDTMLNTATPFLEGQATANAAYANLEAQFMGPGGLYETSYYLGGTGDAPSAAVAKNERIDYAARADETPVRKVLFNITVLAAANDPGNGIPDDQRRDLTRMASENLRSAIGEMTTIASRVGSAQARIADAKARNMAAEAAMTISLNSLSGVDPFQAAVELTQFEDQLETAFATTARMSNLSLANYIR